MSLRMHGIALCLTAVAACSPCLGEDDASAFPITPFRLQKWGGDMFVRGRFNNAQQDSMGYKLTDKETFLEEGLDLNGSGYVYHPNLMTWDAAVRLGAQQDWLTINDQSYNTSSRLLGYNLSALLLKEKFVSFRPFASQTQDFVTRDFAQGVTVLQQRQGLETVSKGQFPMSLLVENVSEQQTGDLRNIDRQTRHALYTVSDQRKPDWLTRFSFDHQDTAETSEYIPATGSPVTQDLPDQWNEAILSNNYKFGQGENKHTLSGRIRLLDRQGFYENKDYLIEQQLDLVHSKTFSTFYSFLFDTGDVNFQKEQTSHVEMGFRKKWFESLDLTGRAYYNDHLYDVGQERTVGGALESVYQKKTPIGDYTCNLRLGKEEEHEQSGTGLRPTRSEAVTLTGISFVRLVQPDILTGSIVVSSADRSIVYTVDVHYTLRSFGAYTEIARIVGAPGGINDGQTVLVDYLSQVGQDATFTTDRFGWGNRLKLKDLPITLYTDLQLTNQKLVAGRDPGNLDQTRLFLAGAELNWQQLSVIYEHEIRDQLLSPSSVSDRLRASYMRPLGRDFDLSLGAQAEHTQYATGSRFSFGTGRDHQDLLGANGTLTAKLRAGTLLRFRSEFLQTSGLQNGQLFKNGLAFEWMYQKLNFSLELRHDIFQQETTTGSADILMFTLLRKF